ncbi:hypothetical protein BJ170DRAFT_599678 [Xylariales sp. AK1849]|nr:hypothetical protein BJ170DRAFT_599678 [Xylariales sp. AK1849]
MAEDTQPIDMEVGHQDALRDEERPNLNNLMGQTYPFFPHMRQISDPWPRCVFNAESSEQVERPRRGWGTTETTLRPHRTTQQSTASGAVHSTAERPREPLSELDPISAPLPLHQPQRPSTFPQRSTTGIPTSYENFEGFDLTSSPHSHIPESDSNTSLSRPLGRQRTSSRTTQRDRFASSSSGNLPDTDLLFSRSSPLSSRLNSPSSRRNSNTTANQNRIQFIFVGTSTIDSLPGHQVWATLHSQDLGGLEYWVDDPKRPLRDILLVVGNSGFQWPAYETVEFREIRLANHFSFMNEDQLIEWVRRLLMVRMGVSDSCFLFRGDFCS